MWSFPRSGDHFNNEEGDDRCYRDNGTWDRDREKASRLATRLAKSLDSATTRVAAPTRTAELRVVGIDISINKDELRQALAHAAGCGGAEVQVEEIGTSRNGLGSAWIRCPVAGARKLAQTGKVILGWSTAKVIAIPRRPLQCFKCLELGHVRATCVSAVDRGHLFYRCGESGHRAPCASHSRLPPTTGWVGGHVPPPPPKTKRKRPVREPAPAAKTQGSTAEVAVDGREEAMELAQ